MSKYHDNFTQKHFAAELKTKTSSATIAKRPRNTPHESRVVDFGTINALTEGSLLKFTWVYQVQTGEAQQHEQAAYT